MGAEGAPRGRPERRKGRRGREKEGEKKKREGKKEEEREGKGVGEFYLNCWFCFVDLLRLYLCFYSEI